MGFRKADDFYIALGQSKISTKVVTNKVMQRLKRGEAVEEEPAEGLIKGTDDARRRTREATSFGIKVKGVEQVAVRLAKCCRPFRATRSSATSHSGAASRSTAPTAATWWR